ncbi:Auxin responsive protein [Musa troglodytarum]|uniref:Auxin responsive protein n=1 Tax=Musa troglodytarum TaxID=320322 RepID=A0A9E7FT46_9LILI|nr:Auxin responsive protein [Musa troglodytarum]
MRRSVRGRWRSTEEGEGAARRGYVPVLVGAAAAEEEGGLQRFLVSVEAFKHARFVSLLEMAAGEFGYQQRGVLRIPCDPEHFRRVLKMPIKDRKRQQTCGMRNR